MKITHHGHSCLLVEVAGVRVLIDPGSFSDLDGLRDLSAICVTHQHPDHVDPARIGTLLADNPDAAVYAEPQAAQHAGELAERAQPLATGATVRIGEVEVTAVGERHAVIFEEIPRIDNRGLVLRAPGSPVLFHPGDALDAHPGAVDLLAVPLSAPWQKLSETIGFVRRIAPGAVFPIHDRTVSQGGRQIYWSQLSSFAQTETLDLNGGSETF